MKYWFKRKRYGYGWVPSTWQGWFLLALYVMLLVLGGVFLLRDETPATENIVVFFTVFIVATGTLLAVTHYVAPKPKWRWGKKPGDNPDEDW